MRYLVIEDIRPSEFDWISGAILAGTIVHGFVGFTYGCITPAGTACTLDGGKTFLELPNSHIKAVQEELLTEGHVMSTCKPGEGDATCRYLVIGPHGWTCAKNGGLQPMIDQRFKEGTMRAKGDNCEGRI